MVKGKKRAASSGTSVLPRRRRERKQGNKEKKGNKKGNKTNKLILPSVHLCPTQGLNSRQLFEHGSSQSVASVLVGRVGKGWLDRNQSPQM